MSESAGPTLLSREELDALLASAAEGALREEQARRSSRPFAGQGEGRARPGRLAALARSLEEFAEEQGRTLSTQHQIAITFEATGWEEVSLSEFGATLLETDLVASVQLTPEGGPIGRGYLLVGRGLLFGWMCLASGSRSGSPGAIPTRPYSRIEERFLARVAKELLGQLERRWRERHPVAASLQGLEEPAAVAERSEGPLLSVTFDVRGMGELCRLRVLLPPAVFDAAEAPAPAVSGPSPRAGLAEPLLEMPVQLHVEAGSAELSLARIAALQPGAVIPLERADAEGLLVRVEDAAKFRAERGALGGRLAARILERIG